MLKQEVLNHFDGKVRSVAEAAGVSTQYVHQWPAIVPEAMAARLDKFTDGDLQYDPDDYRD